jgi:outer membrane protein
MVRGRVLNVSPHSTSTSITGIGGKVKRISSSVVPELDVTYYFNNNIAMELILAVTPHKPKATNTILGTINLGKVTLLPPTLSLQYHFRDCERVRPYLGVGLNYTHFFNIKTGPVASKISYKNSIGPAFQVGTNIALNDNWVVNFDVKKVLIRTQVAVIAGANVLKTKVRIDPMICGIGFGYCF